MPVPARKQQQQQRSRVNTDGTRTTTASHVTNRVRFNLNSASGSSPVSDRVGFNLNSTSSSSRLSHSTANNFGSTNNGFGFGQSNNTPGPRFTLNTMNNTAPGSSSTWGGRGLGINTAERSAYEDTSNSAGFNFGARSSSFGPSGITYGFESNMTSNNSGFNISNRNNNTGSNWGQSTNDFGSTTASTSGFNTISNRNNNTFAAGSTTFNSGFSLGGMTHGFDSMASSSSGFSNISNRNTSAAGSADRNLRFGIGSSNRSTNGFGSSIIGSNGQEQTSRCTITGFSGFASVSEPVFNSEGQQIPESIITGFEGFPLTQPAPPTSAATEASGTLR